MFERHMGQCKHGEFVLAKGCPECMAEVRCVHDKLVNECQECRAEREKMWYDAKRYAESFGTISEPATNIVKVRYLTIKVDVNTRAETCVFEGREYTYFATDPLAVGDMVTVPVRDSISKAKVTAINVPESEIAAFRDKVKTIPPVLPPEDEKLVEMRKSDGEVIAFDTVQQALKQADEGSKIFVTPLDIQPVQEEGPTEANADAPPGMALVKVKTADDQALQLLYQEGIKLEQYASDFAITANEHLTQATNDLAIIAKLKKTMSDKKVEYVGPIRKHLDTVSDAFKAFLAPFEAADQILRSKTNFFRADQERKAKEATAIEAAKMELARQEAELNHGAHTQELGTAVAPPPVPEIVRTDMGTLGGTKVHKWELIDKALVPPEYLMVDSAKVTFEVKHAKGQIEISGIRVWTETTTRVNTR